MRNKHNTLTADADTLITSCNGHQTRIEMKRGDELRLDALSQQYPVYVPPVEPEPALEPGANENVVPESALDVFRRTLPEPPVPQDPSPAPEGWKTFSAYGLTWCEDLSTHQPLGPSATCREKSGKERKLGGKTIGQKGDIE